MPNPITRLLDRFKLWRMQQRGDALVDARSFFDTMIDLADEIVQEPQSEIPRDLFILLAYVFAAKERDHSHDHFEFLRHIRARAWLAYWDAPALGASIVADLPRSEGAVRMKRYFEEIATKRASFLFLPAVFRCRLREFSAFDGRRRPVGRSATARRAARAKRQV
jgi:hypothetical protein